MAAKIKFRRYSTTPPECSPVEEMPAEVSSIASSISKEIARQTDLQVAAVLEDGGKDEWIAWFQSEVEHWKQRAEELEIELECMRDAFPEHDHDVMPKRRRNFNAY